MLKKLARDWHVPEELRKNTTAQKSKSFLLFNEW